MEKSITIITGFVHDFAAGLWAATVLAIYWIHRFTAGNPALGSALAPLKEDFFYLGIICVGIVLLTGVGRTFTYIENFYGKDSEKLRKKMLIIKHILLFGIFGGGTYWQYTMVFN